MGSIYPTGAVLGQEPGVDKEAGGGDEPRELAKLTVGELLRQYREVLIELRVRGLIRTNNAPFGDLAEYCALLVYGGELAANSTASYDLKTSDGRLVQVKARQITAKSHRSLPFSPLRALEFDLCLFLLVEDDDVVCAREWTRADVAEHRTARKSRKDWIVKTGQVLVGTKIGKDRTDEFREAWHRLLAMSG